jgi:hypothetical protein
MMSVLWVKLEKILLFYSILDHKKLVLPTFKYVIFNMLLYDEINDHLVLHNLQNWELVLAFLFSKRSLLWVKVELVANIDFEYPSKVGVVRLRKVRFFRTHNKVVFWSGGQITKKCHLNKIKICVFNSLCLMTYSKSTKIW